MAALESFVAEERAASAIFPPAEEVFSAFTLTPIDEVSVVIVGQDPYHGPGQAHGLCFSVREGVALPPSLKNIYKELQNDLGVETPTHGCLTGWAKQGVLLLNATLTVSQSSPLSHHGKGWELFTDAVIQALCKRPQPIVFLLWGRSAQQKCRHLVCSEERLVLQAPHPSPFSAYQGFFGSRPFSQINEFLLKHNKAPINWDPS